MLSRMSRGVSGFCLAIAVVFGANIPSRAYGDYATEAQALAALNAAGEYFEFTVDGTKSLAESKINSMTSSEIACEAARQSVIDEFGWTALGEPGTLRDLWDDANAKRTSARANRTTANETMTVALSDFDLGQSRSDSAYWPLVYGDWWAGLGYPNNSYYGQAVSLYNSAIVAWQSSVAWYESASASADSGGLQFWQAENKYLAMLP